MNTSAQLHTCSTETAFDDQPSLYIQKRPEYVRITGNGTRADLLSRMVNYSDYIAERYPDQSGWFDYCVEEFSYDLGVSTKTISRNLADLHHQGLIEKRTISPGWGHPPVVSYRINHTVFHTLLERDRNSPEVQQQLLRREQLRKNRMNRIVIKRITGKNPVE